MSTVKENIVSNSKIALVSSSSSFMLDNSMFVVDGNQESGYLYNSEIFFMLGLTNMVDYCFVGQSSPIEGFFKSSKAGTRPFQSLSVTRCAPKLRSIGIKVSALCLGDTDGDC